MNITITFSDNPTPAELYRLRGLVELLDPSAPRTAPAEDAKTAPAGLTGEQLTKLAAAKAGAKAPVDEDDDFGDIPADKVAKDVKAAPAADDDDEFSAPAAPPKRRRRTKAEMEAARAAEAAAKAKAAASSPEAGDVDEFGDDFGDSKAADEDEDFGDDDLLGTEPAPKASGRTVDDALAKAQELIGQGRVKEVRAAMSEHGAGATRVLHLKGAAIDAFIDALS